MVQIVEVSELWVRVAVVTLTRRESPLTFVLFPMVHVGSPHFYKTVRDQVAKCDLAVVEGVGPSRASRLLTLSYRMTRFRRGSGLVVQDIGPDSFDIPVLHPDMTNDDFQRNWRRVPWYDRLTIWCLLPPFALAMLVVGPRWFLARMTSMEDAPSREDLYLDDAMPELVELVRDKRDLLLVEAIAAVHERRRGEDIRVAVVYGAGHIPAVVRALTTRYRYMVRTGTFLTVVDL